MRHGKDRRLVAFCGACVLIIGGCHARHSIISGTGTNIGVEIAQNPTTNTPHAKLGYQRAEFAVVPTNRSADNNTGKGSASEHGEVLMELRYGGIFDTGPSSGIYQRLAVGSVAVRQPGAALMFARNADGQIDPDAKAALLALKSIPEAPADVDAAIAALASLRSCHPDAVDNAVKGAGVVSFDALIDLEFTIEQLATIRESVKNLPACPSAAPNLGGRGSIHGNLG